MGRIITHEIHRYGVFSNVFRDPQKTFATREEADNARDRMTAQWGLARGFRVERLARAIRVSLGY